MHLVTHVLDNLQRQYMRDKTLGVLKYRRKYVHDLQNTHNKKLEVSEGEMKTLTLQRCTRTLEAWQTEIRGRTFWRICEKMMPALQLLKAATDSSITPSNANHYVPLIFHAGASHYVLLISVSWVRPIISY